MDHSNEILKELVQLSTNLGDPKFDYAILGEGNTSAKINDNEFWVKASGSELRTITASGFVRVKIDLCMHILKGDDLNDEQVRSALQAARVDLNDRRMPSVETFLHALALSIPGINFVGHTHPGAINAIMCSKFADQAIVGRLFPDEIVVCGPAPVFVKYTDPGLPLARAVYHAVNDYIDGYGEIPKVILMQNHGFIALGKTSSEVERIHAMYEKTSRVLIGSYSLGGPNFLTQENVDRIHKRPDELYRRKVLEGK